MSLNRVEHAQTAKELQENLSKVALEQVASDLGTTPEKVLAVSRLEVTRIEEPWILRNYLIKVLGSAVAPFTVLTDDYHHLWFLDAAYIDRARLSS